MLSPNDTAAWRARATAACFCCGGDEWRRKLRLTDFDYVECLGCGLQKLDPLPTPQQVNDYYESELEGAAYETRVHFERRDNVNRDLFRWAVREHGGPPKKVLDVGCLYGALLDEFRDAGVETHGVELQKAACESAASKHDGRVFNGTIEAYRETAPGDFDMITSIAVIEHVLDPVSFLSCLKALLKPGGTLILETPNASSRLAKLMGRRWPSYIAVEHIHLFARDSLIRLLEAEGFSVGNVAPHWKSLELGYFYQQTKVQMAGLHKLMTPFWRFVPEPVKRLQLPLYGGDMLISARLD